MRLDLVCGALTGALLLTAPAVTGGPRLTGQPVTLEDDLGREVRLERPPARVVSLVPVVTEILFAIDAGHVLAARSEYDDYPPAVLDLPSVGDPIRPSVELIVQQRPDLVVLFGGADNARLLEELERLDVQVLGVLVNTLADLERTIRRLGRLTGRAAAADSCWRGIRGMIDEVRQRTRDLPRRRVYYDVGYAPNFTVGAGSYLDTLISIAGGQNVFGDVPGTALRVSLEAIVARRPEVIVHPVSAHVGDRSPHPRLRPGWVHLGAVRDGRVVQVDADLLHRLGPRVGRAARVLADALHPGVLDGPATETGSTP